jgi:hypothetical protein
MEDTGLRRVVSLLGAVPPGPELVHSRSRGRREHDAMLSCNSFAKEERWPGQLRLQPQLKWRQFGLWAPCEKTFRRLALLRTRCNLDLRPATFRLLRPALLSRWTGHRTAILSRSTSRAAAQSVRLTLLTRADSPDVSLFAHVASGPDPTCHNERGEDECWRQKRPTESAEVSAVKCNPVGHQASSVYAKKSC